MSMHIRARRAFPCRGSVRAMGWGSYMRPCLCGASVMNSATQRESNEQKDSRVESLQTLLNKINARQSVEPEMLKFLEREHTNNIYIAREGAQDFAKNLPNVLDRALATAPE